MKTKNHWPIIETTQRYIISYIKKCIINATILGKYIYLLKYICFHGAECYEVMQKLKAFT